MDKGRVEHHEGNNSKSNLRPVAVIGVGSTSFGRLSGQDVVSMAVEACRDAMIDRSITKDLIQSLYLGNFASERLSNQGALAPIVAGRLGMTVTVSYTHLTMPTILLL